MLHGVESVRSGLPALHVYSFRPRLPTRLLRLSAVSPTITPSRRCWGFGRQECPKITDICILLTLVQILRGECYSELQHYALCRGLSRTKRDILPCRISFGADGQTTDVSCFGRHCPFYGGSSSTIISKETIENPHCIVFTTWWNLFSRYYSEITSTPNTLGFRCSIRSQANITVSRAGYVNTTKYDDLGQRCNECKQPIWPLSR